ncbi:unnamed protein product [Caenorhabditis angaria]|uniref:C2H2-type domain-containing protein n=1 Tax=Caenorhabditis angaria TaxID=860376 RepID=A0A9P1J5D5_9PELO|nr:unnamed protein product [Caenorhabditis angaria]
MSHVEEAKGGWPHDSIAHLAPHAPIQVQPDSSQGAFHVMQQGTWRLPVPAQFGNIVNKPPLFGSEWRAPADWGANNNKLGEWDKWSTNTEIARPLATFGNSSLTASIMTGQSDAASVVVKADETTQIHPNTEYVSPKEDERKSSEHTNSYDVSASQSPSNHDEEQQTAEKDESLKMDEGEVEPEEEEVEHKKKPSSSMEDSQLLLNFSFGNSKTSDAKETTSDLATKFPLMGFLHSGTSAFSNIEPSILKPSSPKPAEAATPAPPTTSSSSFCRPPGLGPVNIPPPTNGQAAPLVCPICGFSCPSKFHYNSHMNTHGDHQCNMCDYTSRTEGRLKKHMRESHTVEEQLKAGMEIEPKVESSRSSGSPMTPEKESENSNSFMLNLTTTMASILDSTASALAASMASTEMPSSLPTGLKLDINNTPSLISSLTSGALTSSALDQIRAFTENSNLIPDGGLTLASALGAVSQAMAAEPKTPEKHSHGGETRRSSSGKVKILKCKQCGHQSLSKDDQWLHARSHIPNEKQLNCQHCNFVTEYKHHLEYHYRNHLGSKPFQCKKCAYTCVNKSMLNSHMKSHTNHYQFRCMDCTYATKYCHSLKLHLKKYNHRRVPDGIEMNGGDSSPTLSNSDTIQSYPSLTNLANPSSQEKKTSEQQPATTVVTQPQQFNFAPMVTSQSLNYASQMLLKHHQMDGGLNPLLLQNLNTLTAPASIPLKCPMCEVQCSSQDEQMRHNMSHFMNSSVPTTLASLYNNISALGGLPSAANTNETETSMEVDDTTDEPDNYEGSRHEDEEMDQLSDCAHASPTSIKTSSVSCDEEIIKEKSPTSSSASIADKEDTETHVESSVSPPSEQNSESSSSQIRLPISMSSEAPLMINTSESGSLNNLLQQACLAINALQAKQRESNFNNFTCPHCKMGYHNQALYNIHMSHHCYEHPFKCSRCDFTGTDSLNFNIHLLQSSHDTSSNAN